MWDDREDLTFRQGKIVWRKTVWRRALLPVPAGKARLLVPTVVIMMSLLPIWAISAKPSTEKLAEDLPGGAMQAKATAICMECHGARIILQQRLSKAAWAKEVDKMTKWGAVVDPNDRDALIDYLSTNFSPEKPAYQPPRTALVKSDAGTNKK